MPLRRCSRSTIFLNTHDKKLRDSLVLPFTQLQKLDDNDENVYCKNIIDRYAARPQNLEDMSLAEFAANYTYKQETNNDVAQCEDVISGGSDAELQCNEDLLPENTITLKNGLGSMRKRKKKAQFHLRKRARETFQIMHHVVPPMERRRQVTWKFQIIY